MKFKREYKNLNKAKTVKSEYPYKVYSVTYDGNRNEFEVFESAFKTLKEAENYIPDHDDYHAVLIDVEEDE